MRSISLIASIALCTGCAHTDQWTDKDTKHFATYVAAASLDTFSTNRLINDFYYTEERNPVIVRTFGQRPSKKELIVGTIVISITNFFIARAIPEKYRRKYLSIWTFGHTTLSMYNFNLYNKCAGIYDCGSID